MNRNIVMSLVSTAGLLITAVPTLHASDAEATGDAALKGQLQTRLAKSDDLDASHISTEVRDGVAYLQGTAASEAEISHARAIAAGMQGVKEVQSRIRIDESLSAASAASASAASQGVHKPEARASASASAETDTRVDSSVGNDAAQKGKSTSEVDGEAGMDASVRDDASIRGTAEGELDSRTRLDQKRLENFGSQSSALTRGAGSVGSDVDLGID